jgi:hypothetical protein
MVALTPPLVKLRMIKLTPMTQSLGATLLLRRHAAAQNGCVNLSIGRAPTLDSWHCTAIVEYECAAETRARSNVARSMLQIIEEQEFWHS